MFRADDWRTPPELFAVLDREFCFRLDAAADEGNALCSDWLSDALGSEPWPIGPVFCNPPYGRMLDPFVRRCALESTRGKRVVALIPMRTRAAWWHEAVLGQAHEVRCIRKRVHFLRPDGTRPKLTPSCDSCAVVWHPNQRIRNCVEMRAL